MYLDGIRQLKLVGILTTAILTVLAIVVPAACGISFLINHPQVNYSDASWNNSDDQIVKDIIYGVYANPFLFAIFLVVAPLMALMLFSFLSKRRTSDFYHSIPHTRACIFISFSASVLTWVAIEILATSLGAALTYLIFNKYFELLIAELLMFMLSTFAASVLAVGAVSIAVSLTGTTGSNILLSIMILFIPRIIIFAFSSNILAQTPILVETGIFPLLADDYNLYTALFFGSYRWSLRSQDFTYYRFHGIIYSLILGLIYLGLGLLFFVRRKSESAERSAPSRGLQAFYRTLLTCTFCLIPCILIFQTVTDGYDWRYDNLTLSVVVLYIVALLIYFSYELITTRKWKNLLRVIPGLGIVAAANLIVVGGLFGIRAYNLSFSPDADEIAGISVIFDDKYYNSGNFEDYVNCHIDEVVLNSDEVKELVSETLSMNASELKVSVNEWGSHQKDTEKMTFIINTKFGSKIRRIKIDKTYADTIKKKLLDDKQYYDLWTNLPKPARNSLSYSYGNLSDGSDPINMPRIFVNRFTDTLREEISEIDPYVLIDLVKNSEDENSYDQIAIVYYPLRVGMSVNTYRIPISYRYMPRSAALILEMNSNNSIVQQNALEELEQLYMMTDEELTNSSGYGEMIIYEPNSSGVLYGANIVNSVGHLYTLDTDILEKYQAIMALLLKKAECRPVEYGEPFMELILNIDYYDKENPDSENKVLYYHGFVPLPSLTVDELDNLNIRLSNRNNVYVNYK